MEKCFVIQPFDNDKFDKRFDDVYKPAIINADLEAYRIDRDPSTKIIIDDIEKGIIDSKFCLAEITTDNPNVWYELGFAFACNKDVVIICSDERVDKKLPFDIQHRHIITYKTGSLSDYQNLSTKITEKIKALQNTSKIIKKLHEVSIVETEGLKGHEVALLILIAENQITKTDTVSINSLKNQMRDAGYTDIATSIGIRSLIKNKLILSFTEIDSWNNNNEYNVCQLTDAGEEWILSNQEQLQMRKTEVQQPELTIADIPF